jgi:uncharacterized protein (TIGR02246 family)
VDNAEDTLKIRQVMGKFVEAWNHNDAKAFSMVFAEDADFSNVRGMSAHGRTAIARFHAPLFDTNFRSSHQKINEITVRFLKPDVAAVSAWWEMSGARNADGTVLLCLHEWGAHEHPPLTSPDHGKPGNDLLLFFRVDDFEPALKRARGLVPKLAEEPHWNPNTGTMEFALRDPHGYYVMIGALSAV